MKQLIACTVALAFSVSGWAMPITGDLGIAGDVVYDDTAQTLEFSNEVIIGASGDFAHLAPMDSGFIRMVFRADIGDIDVSGSPTVAGPWTLVDFLFTPVTVSMSRNGSFFDFILRGVMSSQGFDDTEYAFALSTNPGRLIGTFSAATVPEPGSIALFAAGLLGVVVLRRRTSRPPRRIAYPAE